MKKPNESNNRTTLPNADLEQATSNRSVCTEALPRFTTPVNIRVISYRKRNHDPDGISVKAALDAIVRAGILVDDSTKEVKSVCFESRKAQDEEKTIIVIEDEKTT